MITMISFLNSSRLLLLLDLAFFSQLLESPARKICARTQLVLKVDVHPMLPLE